jgi:hypothetical protein
MQLGQRFCARAIAGRAAKMAIPARRWRSMIDAVDDDEE